ncbi:hypothetical protein [Amycolatopsis sp. NPDC051903]|uniref:hypothetical protein n=1 Tax=Amycolatopsis sp. NPDC051903 TaxID=3363936 RepID=UPI0037AF5100
MQSVLRGIAVLACPIGMWLMMRGQRKNPSGVSSADQVAQLRAEVERLKTERAKGAR